MPLDGALPCPALPCPALPCPAPPCPAPPRPAPPHPFPHPHPDTTPTLPYHVCDQASCSWAMLSCYGINILSIKCQPHIKLYDHTELTLGLMMSYWCCLKYPILSVYHPPIVHQYLICPRSSPNKEVSQSQILCAVSMDRGNSINYEWSWSHDKDGCYVHKNVC